MNSPTDLFTLGLAARWLHRLTLAVLLVAGIFLSAPQARAASACCGITNIDVKTQLVTAKETVTGRTFTFKVSDAKLLNSLKVGQGVYANFATKQVSIDGKTACCSMVSVSVTTATNLIGSSAKNPVHCCSIASIDLNAAVVTATETATGKTFQFKVGDAALLKSLRTGQGVYANFGAQQVSVDGVAPCCPIVGAPISTVPLPGNATPSVQTAPRAHGAQIGAGTPFKIPQVSAGAPQLVQSGGLLTARAPGRLSSSVSGKVVQLHGIDGIRAATGLPQGVQDFLLLHASTLPAGEVDNYVVNVQLAQQWFAAHPEPDSVKKAVASHNSHAGCTAISTECLEQAGEHALDEASRQSQKLLQQAQDEWNHLSDEANHDWNMAQGCFVERTLTLPNVPVQFNVTPQFPLSFEKDGKTSNKYGGASGKVQGTVTFGVPMQANFGTQVDMFYIPCLPFAVRPKDIAANGTLAVGSTLGATLTASGQFEQLFSIPPAGGPHFPIYVIPIVIDGVPIAEMDVSVYVDGTVDVDGQGTLNGAVKVQTMENTAFDFNCSGQACTLNQHSVPEPVTTTESVKIAGRIHVKPAVYAALQLDFDVDLLTARAGPQPFLLGEIYGCSSTTATQSSAGTSSSQEYYALTADLDWGVDLRAEALVGPKKVAEKIWKLTQHHIYFKDLANSTALIPTVAGNLQPAAGQGAVYSMNMPACYPYSDQVEYAVSWNGGASGASAQNSTPVKAGAAVSLAPKSVGSTASGTANPACTLQPSQASCWSDPLKNVALSLAWPSMGNYQLNVVPVRDKHGRIFDASRATQLNINVQQASANATNP